MDAVKWERAKELFHEAVCRAPDERESFLAAACGNDAELLSEVRDLIRSHEAASQVLTDPGRASSNDAPGGPGTSIGPYKLLQVIGNALVPVEEQSQDFQTIQEPTLEVELT